MITWFLLINTNKISVFCFCLSIICKFLFFRSTFGFFLSYFINAKSWFCFVGIESFWRGSIDCNSFAFFKMRVVINYAKFWRRGILNCVFSFVDVWDDSSKVKSFFADVISLFWKFCKLALFYCNFSIFRIVKNQCIWCRNCLWISVNFEWYGICRSVFLLW